MPAPPGLYVHIPFCSAICPYCDFAVTTGGVAKRSAFLAALVAEIDLVEELWAPVDTIYLGGGTPSALAATDLARLVERLRQRFDPAGAARLFLEANPEDVTPQALDDWLRLGVRTLSLGVQSFDRDTLQTLGRRHGPEESRASVEFALSAGLETVSVDLIYGVPGSSKEKWKKDLDTAIGLQPHHLSCYQLTFHPRTAFGRWKKSGRMVEPTEGERADLFFLTHRRLEAAGYDGYEVSNFALGAEHRSGHNAKYWRRIPYLGLGPSAHSSDGVAHRWWNERKLEDWQRRIAAGERPIAGDEELSAREVALEDLMLGLRTAAGVDLGALDRKLGLEILAKNQDRLANWRADGLIEMVGGRVVPMLPGLAVADRLAAELEI